MTLSLKLENRQLTRPNFPASTKNAVWEQV